MDPAERDLLNTHGVTVPAPREGDPQNIAAHVAARQVWIHVDGDVLEPGYVPAASKVPHGLRPDRLAAIFAAVPTGQVCRVGFARFEHDDGVPVHLNVESIPRTFRHRRGRTR